MRKRNSVATTTTNNEIPRPEATHILTTFSSHPDKGRLLGKRPIRVADLLPVCLPAYYPYASLTYTRTRCRTRCRLTPYASLACCSYASLLYARKRCSTTSRRDTHCKPDRFCYEAGLVDDCQHDIHCERDAISTASPTRYPLRVRPDIHRTASSVADCQHDIHRERDAIASPTRYPLRVRPDIHHTVSLVDDCQRDIHCDRECHGSSSA
jgi:hypothetical protein